MSRGQDVPPGRWLLFWSIALGGAIFDLATKSWIFDWVGPPGSPAKPLVADILELRTTYNTGALWGLGNNLAHGSLMFAGLSIIASLAILYWLFAKGGAQDRLLTIALGLVMAGALGNCYDRVVHGHVRDFVHFHVDSIDFNFAIFNFADNMLVAGSALLVLLALRPEETDQSATSEPPAATTTGGAPVELSASSDRSTEV